jgi:L-ascorbate metabolism protein UlaG (beta-lactamase superfamily)
MNAIARKIVLLLAPVLLSATAARPQDKPTASGLTVRFWGQACVTIEAGDSTLLIDPYNPGQVGYSAFEVAPQVVLISHEHFDHNDTSWVKGHPLVLHGLDATGQVQAIDRTVGPFHVRSVAARHWQDPAQKARGNVAIFVIEVAGVRIVHLSDLGQKLDARQIEAIGVPDVLLVPVGGFFTIDAEQAYEVVGQLKPRAYVIPMHYRTPALVTPLRSRLAEPGAFVRKFGDHVLRIDGNQLPIDPARLPSSRQVVPMDYRPAAADTQPHGSGPAELKQDKNPLP